MTPRDPSPAEQRAAAETAARARLDTGREALEKIRARELVEAEAHALAQIRIQTERSLAHQAVALRDAERKAEMAAIERRTADLDAIKEAQRRTALDEEARSAAEARRIAAGQAEQAAREKLAALAVRQAAIAARRAAVGDLRAAAKGRRLARLRLAWAMFRCASPWKVLIVALLLGAAAGYGWAVRPPPATAAGTGEEAPLKLERELLKLPR